LPALAAELVDLPATLIFRGWRPADRFRRQGGDIDDSDRLFGGQRSG
jgi:hypothetical protein